MELKEAEEIYATLRMAGGVLFVLSGIIATYYKLKYLVAEVAKECIEVKKDIDIIFKKLEELKCTDYGQRLSFLEGKSNGKEKK